MAGLAGLIKLSSCHIPPTFKCSNSCAGSISMTKASIKVRLILMLKKLGKLPEHKDCGGEIYLVITLAAWSWTNLYFSNAFETLHAALELK